MRKSRSSRWLAPLLKQLSIGEINNLLNDWRLWARDDQLPPDGPWRQWLVIGGRGAGKTRTGAEWVKAMALGQWHPHGQMARRIALVAPNFAEARLVMIEGESGLLAIHQEQDRPKFEPSKRLLTWPNGCVAQIFSAAEPDGLRGPQFDAAWCDELAKWKQASEVWNMLQFALRLGEAPRAVITTTPRPIPVLKELLNDQATVVSRATTFDNHQNLASPFLTEIMNKYAGTRLGRQELDGEMIEDHPDALFQREIIEKHRVSQPPELRRIIVAVDPPASAHESSNACGIIVAGLGHDGRCYVLEDATVQGKRPAQWAAHAIGRYHAWAADRIIAEVNQGGAMVEQVLRDSDETISFKAVHASHGKSVRAEPVAALYEQGRVSHAGRFAELEDELCTGFSKSGKSPDRMDALVWAITELALRRKKEPRLRVV